MTPEGYGQIGWNGERIGVHRLVYELIVEPIPKGMVIDHVRARGCMSRACCWPGHLEPVTNRENVLRGLSAAALNVTKTRCPKGHEYNGVNSAGARECSICRNEQKVERRRRAAALEGLAVIPVQHRTHCPQGHPYDEENTHVSKDGSRECKICRREKWKRYDARRRSGEKIPLRPLGPRRRPLTQAQYEVE